jgi:LysM domain
MGMTSATEAKLSARIRPDVAQMRARTSYPRRRLSLVPAAVGDPAAASGPEEVDLPEAVDVPEPVRVTSGATRRAEADGPIRLTRRGRIVVGVLTGIGVIAVAGLIWLLVGSQAQAASQVQSGQAAMHAMRRIVVRPGQTLWSIAVAADPTADPRATIRQIVDDNELSGTTIAAGQVLWVPRS